MLFEHTVCAAEIEDGRAVLRVQPNGGPQRREVFDHVLACDGATSAVREALRIEMKGPPSIARFASCYFKADLNRYFGEHTGPVHFLGGGDVPGILVCFDMKHTWALMCVMPPGATREQFSRETMLQLVRRAIGVPSVEVELISVGAWNMSAQVAAEMRRGPFFLLGDAAHRFPPTGGLGLNTGIQDAHNLVWKLAAVARGAAGDALLDTYAAERLPVAARNCAHSTRNAMKLRGVELACGVQFIVPVDPAVVERPPSAPRDHGIAGDSAAAVAKRERIAKAIADQRAHFIAPRIDLGYRYGEGDGIVADYDAMPGVEVGARIPHAWLELDGGRVCTLDLPVEHGYTLLIPPPDNGWDAFAAELDARRVSLRRIPECILFASDRRAVLVRPDGHVLWLGVAAGPQLFEAISRLHAGHIERDAPPPRITSESEKATMTLQTRAGIRPTKLAHVVLRSDERLDAMAEWYRDLLNAEIVHQDMMTCFMTYDDEHHRLAIVRAPGAGDRPPGTVGLEHFAFTYANLSDLLETYARLKRQGTEPILTINHGATTSIYYEDPDRNRVELQVDNFDSVPEFVDFIRSGAMEANPIGQRFDADEMLAKLRAGTPAKALQAYPLPPSPVDMSVIERLGRN